MGTDSGRRNDGAPPSFRRGWGAGASRRSNTAQFGELDVRPLSLHVPEQPGGGVAQRGPGNDIVHLAVLQQEFGRLKAVRQILADGLFDDPLSREADHGAGLGQHDVALHRK